VTEPGLTPQAVVALVLAAVSAGFDWWAVGVDRKKIEYVAKPAALIFLIGAAILLDPADQGVRVAFVVALLFGLLGDVFLMIGRFIPGAAAFLVGHVAYIVGFVLIAQWSMGLLVGAVFVVGLLIPGRRIVAGAWQQSHVLGSVVVAYLGVLSVVAILGIGSGSWLAVVGVVLFAISDALNAWRRFVAEIPGGRVPVHVTYHLAQGFLVLSLLQLAGN
jgi:uncharacterized membrane protein YhhN